MRLDKAGSLFEAFETGTLYDFGIDIHDGRSWRTTSYIFIIYNYADAVKLPYPETPVQDIVSEGSMSWQDIEMPYISQRSKFQNVLMSFVVRLEEWHLISGY